jgi:hypothetical protein
MSQPQANEWVHRLTPFLNTALGHQQQLPAASPVTLRRCWANARDSSSSSTEWSTPSSAPKNPERQRQFYSDYRNFKAGFEDTLIETACGLHNLRSNFPIEAWLKAA